MSRFFFHTNNPADEPEGFEFADLRAAKCEAVRYAGQLLCDEAAEFWDNADFELTVTDEKGLIRFTMRMVGTEAPAIRAQGKNR